MTRKSKWTPPYRIEPLYHYQAELISSTAIENIGERLSIIGTIHVDPQSAHFASQTILRLRPQVVALELDEARLAALKQTGKRGNALAGGLSFLVMVLLEKFAGNLTGSAPGSEMLQAAEAAQRVGSSIQFIDLPISATISAIRKLSFSEKLKLGLDSLVSITILPLAKLSFSRITEDMETQIRLFRRRHPELGRILIDQREEYMTRRIEDIMDATAGRVIVIVGYGHMKSLARRLESFKRRTGFSTTTSWIVPT